MNHEQAMSGDLIQVEKSEWYTAKDGKLLRVCEMPGWAIVGRDIYVAPRDQVSTFWGPDHGPPDGTKRERMSSSGGPYKTATLLLLPKPEFIERRQDTFWCWKDWPRSDGGMEYQKEVSLWKLSVFPDDAWLDPDLGGKSIPGTYPPGPIRLACASCERNDFDGVYKIPEGWTEIQFVQTLKQSAAEIPFDDASMRSVTEWYTHLGICPECNREDADEEETP